MTILCYHTVEPDWDSPLALEPELFEAHCRWLARRRQVVPLEDALDRWGASRLPRGGTALTFDDGFLSLYTHALPVLSRYGLPATVFLVAQTLTLSGQKVDWVDTPPEHELRTLGVEQVREMQAAGMTFASHSWSHADLTQLDYSECVRDLRESRELLEALLGHPVSVLAYPRGRHDEKTRAAAERAGYRYALALPEGPEAGGRYAIPRVGLYRGNDVRTLRVKSARAYLPVRTSRAYAFGSRLRGLPRRTHG